LPDHGKFCFVGLLGCLPLTDGVCDDVLDVVKGIASETVIELMQEEKGICEHIGDTSICSQEGISIFKFPEMFLKISCRDLITFTFSTTLI
jgi:hypothetical protein